MSTLLLDAAVDGILAGAGDPPAADERRALGELGALLAAAAERRPELTVVLAGGMADQLAAFGDVSARPAPVVVAPAAARRRTRARRCATRCSTWRLASDDARRALGAAALSLAEILDRRVDVVEIGFDGGARVGGLAGGRQRRARASTSRSSRRPGWRRRTPTTRSSTGSRRGRAAPATATGCATGCASCGSPRGPTPPARASSCGSRPRAPRSAAWPSWTPDWAGPARRGSRRREPAGSGRSPPAPSVVLALVDVLRRSGASQYALDHARLLAPLGSIPDPAERRAVMTDLLDDLLAPLGLGRDAGRPAARPKRRGAPAPRSGRHARRWSCGRAACRVVDLPPGAAATAEFRFHDTVRLGGRGRHFAIDVTGGLGGLLVDLRDVPLRLPDRADLRARAARELAGRRLVGGRSA